jgi:hypothetical protein
MRSRRRTRPDVIATLPIADECSVAIGMARPPAELASAFVATRSSAAVVPRDALVASALVGAGMLVRAKQSSGSALAGACFTP